MLDLNSAIEPLRSADEGGQIAFLIFSRFGNSFRGYSLELQALVFSRSNNLLNYYQKNNLQVAFRKLDVVDRFNKYQTDREEFLNRKLGLPSSYFLDKNVVEFGPGSGENSMCFALQGASMSLVEPNLSSHSQIIKYFEQYKLRDRLVDLHCGNMESFKSDKSFDFVDAEGFVATIQPSATWLKVANRLLNKNGLMLVSYFERHGSFFERFINALAHVMIVSTHDKKKLPLTHIDMVLRLMKHKWEATRSLRSIETWYYDHISNPYAMRSFQIDAPQLIEDAAKFGFTLQSSCPNYCDNISVGWYKSILPEDVRIMENKEFIYRNSLSFMLGEKIFFTGEACELKKFYMLVLDVLDQLNEVENGACKEAVETLCIRLKTLVSFIEKNSNCFFSNDKVSIINGLSTIVECFELGIHGNLNSLDALLEGNAWYNKFWGTPVHFCLFRKIS